MSKIEVIDFHQTAKYNGIKFVSYGAGHVLGAAMFLVEIDGIRILYTGDFSRHEDRHLMPAELPLENPDVLIVESTYGIRRHESRKTREERFTGPAFRCVSVVRVHFRYCAEGRKVPRSSFRCGKGSRTSSFAWFCLLSLIHCRRGVLGVTSRTARCPNLLCRGYGQAVFVSVPKIFVLHERKH